MVTNRIKAGFAGAGIAAAMTFAVATPASAQYPTNTVAPDQVLGEVFEQAPAPAPAPATAPAVQGQALPVTGGDVLTLTLVGGGAIIAGAAVLQRRKRIETPA